MQEKVEAIKMPIEKKKFDYKWVILILCVLMNFVCLGFCSGNKSMYLMAITDALDIPRSLFSLSESSRYIGNVVCIREYTIKKQTSSQQ